MRLFEAFPYAEWRAGQREIARAVYEAVSEGRIELVEYPTGAGKTVAVLIGALEAALEAGRVVLYLARTKSQAQAPFRELRRLIRRGVRIRLSFFRNKREMCALRGAELLEYEEFLSQCKFLRERGLCRYYERALRVSPRAAELLMAHSPTPLDFIESCKRAGLCPYEVARALARRADVIIGTYRYLFDDKTRESFLPPLGLELSDVVVVIDEAHNLPGGLSEIYSASVSEATVRAARREVREYLRGPELEALARMLASLQAYMRRAKRARSPVLSPHDFVAHVAVPPEAEELVNKVLVAKYLREGTMRSYVLRVYSLIKSVYGRREGYVLYAEREDGSVRLCHRCVLPAPTSSKLFEAVCACVMMSGTLPPSDYLALMLGLPRERVSELRLPSPFPADNRLVVVSREVTTRYSERTERMFRRLAEYVSAVYEASPPGVVLAVFPSYDLMKSVRPYLSAEGVMVERQDTKIEDVERAVRSLGKSLVLAVAGGKVVEGVEFTREGRSLVRAVVVVGMPYPEPDVPTKFLEDVLSIKLGSRERAWDMTFLVPAVTRVRQAAGRAIRSRGDRAVIVVLDRRFEDRRVAELSPDLSQSAVVVDDLGGLMRAIRSFYEKT